MRQDTIRQQQRDFEQGGCRFPWEHAALLFEATKRQLDGMAMGEEKQRLGQALIEMMVPWNYDHAVWDEEGRFLPADGLDEHPFVLRRWFPIPYPL